MSNQQYYLERSIEKRRRLHEGIRRNAERIARFDRNVRRRLFERESSGEVGWTDYVNDHQPLTEDQLARERIAIERDNLFVDQRPVRIDGVRQTAINQAKEESAEWRRKLRIFVDNEAKRNITAAKRRRCFDVMVDKS